MLDRKKLAALCFLLGLMLVALIAALQLLAAVGDTTLEELHQMTKRIEQLSKAEHDLIRDVHPKVDEIKEKVDDVAAEFPPKHPRQSDRNVGTDRIREINSLRLRSAARGRRTMVHLRVASRP